MESFYYYGRQTKLFYLFIYFNPYEQVKVFMLITNGLVLLLPNGKSECCKLKFQSTLQHIKINEKRGKNSKSCPYILRI